MIALSGLLMILLAQLLVVSCNPVGLFLQRPGTLLAIVGTLVLASVVRLATTWQQIPAGFEIEPADIAVQPRERANPKATSF